ncbi:MAG: hypothetical protein IJL87_08745, partial [Clostridia bacterium]|nr:hypothetical protein [Clostridia bacterium]
MKASYKTVVATLTVGALAILIVFLAGISSAIRHNKSIDINTESGATVSSEAQEDTSPESLLPVESQDETVTT